MPMPEDVQPSPSAETLRAAMVEKLREQGAIRTREVERAFRTVPRHIFAPEASLEEAYALRAVVTKRDEHGIATSSVSDPHIQAVMLEQARLRIGQKVLELGSGGYKAALMAELVGADGTVVTVDIDPFVTDRASRFLQQAGYWRVVVRHGDAENGAKEDGPYDHVMVTFGAWDIPPAWTQQLADGGILTVPLRINGLTRSIAFQRESDRLVSRSSAVCGFVAAQGAGAHEERLLLLRGKEVGLRFDDGLVADPGPLAGVLDTSRAETWSAVEVGRDEPFDLLPFWLATTTPTGFCLLSVDPDLDTGAVQPSNRMACPTVIDGDSLAHLALRKISDDRWEFGAHGYGPRATALAERLAEQVKTWDHAHRHGPGPRITVSPAGTPDDQLPPGTVIDKAHTRLTVSWA
ncbi:methyltransferase, FxLD system [Kitasatospora sp. NPDC051914]|uniref:methyltransferase, FxLD system n=1 Tax=Kitasatospora sp. NPDC051914 TaxID=3154945 RepID=UPI003419BD77